VGVYVLESSSLEKKKTYHHIEKKATANINSEVQQTVTDRGTPRKVSQFFYKLVLHGAGGSFVLGRMPGGRYQNERNEL